MNKILTALTLSFALNAHAETLEHALAKAKQSFLRKEDKKKIREQVKLKYKPQFEALKQQQADEIEKELDKASGVVVQ